MIIVDGDHEDVTVDEVVSQVETWVQSENGPLQNRQVGETKIRL